MIDFMALKTLSGGLYHSLTTYQVKEFSGYNWDCLCSHLKIPVDTIHSVYLKGYGFFLETRYFRFQYTHDEYDTNKRIVQISG
jgi:hypothetical protein